MTGERDAWKSWLGAAAVVLGVLIVAHHGTELTRHAVMQWSMPAGEFPPAVCPPDELEEENLSLAECRQMVSNVRNYTLSAPAWFAAAGTALAAAGLAAGLASIVAGAALLDRRRWAVNAGLVAFGALTLIDAGVFVAALNAGPILRDLYLWDTLTWFTLHLMLILGAAAGIRTERAEAPAGAAGAVAPDDASLPVGVRGFNRTAAICHIALALSVLFLFASSWWMLALPLPSDVFTYRAFPFQLHKNLGMTLLPVLAVLLYLRFRRPPRPPASERLPGWMHKLAAVNHAALYGLVVAAVWSGYMSSSYSGWATTLWWLVELPYWGHEDEALNIFYSDVHLWSCWALLIVIAAHVAGAVYHAFRSDGFVRRMLHP